MPQYTITNITPIIDPTTGSVRQDTYGNAKYKLFVKDSTGQVFNFSKGYKGEPAKVGDTITGTLEEKTGNYGPYYQFVAERQGGNWNGGGGRAERDPEVQNMIVRQNALTNAVTFLSEKAKLEKKADTLSTDNVLMIAQKFAAFSQGKLEVKPPAKDTEEPPVAEEDPFGDLEEY